MLHHSGGINGFSTMQEYFPEESLSVVYFTNTETADPVTPATRIARLVLGLPLT